MDFLRGIVGVVGLLGIAYALSNNRKKIRFPLVAWGIGLQFLLGLFLLKTTIGRTIFSGANTVVSALLGFSERGSEMIFGNLINATLKVSGLSGEVIGTADVGQAFFAFKVLPTIIFFSAFMSCLYYLGIMQFVIKWIAFVMAKTLKTSGSETLSVTANIFVGQTEAPLVVKPFVQKMTESELNAVMAGGFATVAGGVMAAYVGFLKASVPDIAGHLMTASIMSAPAALVMAKIMFPENQKSETAGEIKVNLPKTDVNIVDAAANGTLSGLQLCLNVGAMLIAFLGLIHLLDAMIMWVTGLILTNPLTLKMILGTLFSPVAFLLGAPLSECQALGNLLGTKVVLNEFVAYLDLGSATDLSHKTKIIASYALCGFANVSSIGIQIGGIGGIAPERRHDLARIAPRALIAGALASFMTGTIAGMLV